VTLCRCACAFLTRSFVSTTPKSFRKQLQLFAEHGIIISPHGAGLMNTLWLTPGSAVIELFPYHIHHTLYPTLAAQVGVRSFPIHSVNGSIVWRRDKVGPAIVRAWYAVGVKVVSQCNDVAPLPTVSFLPGLFRPSL
jgi:hypothetical protein